MLVLFKFHDYTKLDLVGKERKGMEIDVPRPPAPFSHQQLVKWPLAFSFKLNFVLKNSSSFFFCNKSFILKENLVEGTPMFIVLTSLKILGCKFLTKIFKISWIKSLTLTKREN